MLGRGFVPVLGALALLVVETPSRALAAAGGSQKAAERARIAELEAQLRAERPETRRSAVRGLAELKTREGWSLVLAALEDRDSLVGDAAQRALSGLALPEVLAELLEERGLESRHDVARQRAAEAIGRLTVELDAERLARALSDRDPEAARLLLWSLERLAQAHRLTGRLPRLGDRVEHLARTGEPPELAARALLTLTALGHPDLAALIARQAESRKDVLRSAALLCAQRLGLESLPALARALASDPQPRVRALSIDVLEELGTRAALSVLVDRLEAEERPGLRLRIVEALQRTTGFKHRLDPRPWRLLVQGMSSDWRASRPAAARPEAGAAGDTVVKNLRLPVDSDRVAFLFDFSGSMWTPLADGRMPKDIVAGPLRAALESLSPEAEFNLVPFTYGPLPWQEGLVPAKPARIREALEFFDRCSARGKGNFYDAALLALSDPRVDRIVVLTDGVPTGGTHSDMDLVVPLLLEHDLFARVAFDAVLVDAPGACVRRWRELAERTHGRVLEVSY